MLLFVHIAKADRGSSPVRSQQRPPGADGGESGREAVIHGEKEDAFYL